ncbi:MAG: SPASM domain-containing protein, partial [Clostridiales bacterium]|nr:SPASM domain-containing protein [Clostridiales bacterium]
RCDAGIGRFALAGDKKIYCCPAAAGIKDGEIGDLENGIRRSEILKTWNKLNNPACSGCAARGACGGECKIVSYNRYGSFDGVDPTMCKIKRHLYKLSKMFVSELSACNNEMLDWLEKTCAQTEAYYDKDDRLITAVRLAKGRYTFTEMKKIKDGDLRQFEAIYNELKKSSCS